MRIYLCNKCFKNFTPNKTAEFYLTSCRHIFCKTCILSECPICKRNANSCIISKDMPASVAELFEEPKKLLKLYQQAMKFQCEQEALYNLYYVDTLSGQINKEKKNRQPGLIRMAHKIDSLAEIEEQRIAKLKKYFAHKQRALEQPIRLGTQSSSNKREGSEAASICIHTPTIRSGRDINEAEHSRFNATF